MWFAGRRHTGFPGMLLGSIAIGSAASLLVDASQRANLMVTGARRHGMLIGPVSQTVLQHADCPVAVVPLT